MSVDNTVRTYDPKEIIVVFGAVTASGYAEGEFVNISRGGDAFTAVKGADGGVDRVNNNNNMFEVELTLKQTSLTNDLLSALLIADITGNAGVLELVVKDVLGTTLFVAPQAWIKKDPDSTFSDAMGNRVWTFETGNSAHFVGSNS